MSVYVKKPASSSQTNCSSTWFIRSFEGPYIVVSHVQRCLDLLGLRHESDNTEPSTVSVEKLLVVPPGDPRDLHPQDL